MQVTVVLEHRFVQTQDGATWTKIAFANSFWQRYLDVFDHVRIIARALAVEALSSGWQRVDGERVSFAAVPHYIGPWQYLRKRFTIQRVVREAFRPGQAVIMRMSSPIAAPLETYLRQMEYPYGLEVVGDPYGTFSSGAVKHPLRPFFRWWFSRQLREQCMRSAAVAYVTQQALQKRYPPALDAFSTHYSSIELKNTDFGAAREFEQTATMFTLIIVGTIDQPYKAHDVLIDALGISSQRGLNLRLLVVGDGRNRLALEQQVRQLGLSSNVFFLGQLPAGTPVREQLDLADLFVLPSRYEGLPRAMIEAMARGLPCIGSTVGGIPELLPPEDMVPPGDAVALADKIHEVLSDPQRMCRMSARNLKKAREYHEDVLRERRIEFYQYVREKTEEWIARNAH
ncbi:MAG: glycosyltransferase family 4 protein [Anaerolineae bacterium]|nr:glycosyltransferase family 4 protein [Anaerolineae bacterium]